MIQVSLLIVFFVFIVVNATITPQTKYITQSVDHFNFQVKHTFQQRYLLVDEFFKQHGNKSEPWGGATRPIFMYTGNEAPITAFFEISGFVLDLAKKFNALVIFAEHRYYGESLPFGKDSFEINNVGFLNVEQALFDYVKLIESLKLNNHLLKHSPVVTFGGSYGGSLSAYMRMQYPQIVDISLASSAPILLYDFQAPFFTESTAFFDGVTDSFEQLSSSCTATIRHAMQLLETESDVAIKHQMNLCETIDGNTVSLWARSAFVTLMQTNYPTPDGGQPAWPATHACHAIDEAVKRGDSPLTAIGKAMSIVYNDTHQLKCFNVTAEYARCSDASGCGGPKSLSDSVKAWDYQACTEMIHPIGSDGAKSMFPQRPWSLKELSAYCEQAWGVTPSLSSRPLHTSLLQTDRIIYSSGALDPWRVGCVLPGRVKNLPKNAVTIFMEHAAHHVDLRTPSAADPASITAGRTKETALISQWLREIYLQRHL